MNNQLRERLATYAHNSWAGWMVWLFSKGTYNEDGSFTIEASWVARWRRQMHAAYWELPEAERESDRKEATRIMEIVVEHLNTDNELPL